MVNVDTDDSPITSDPMAFYFMIIGFSGMLVLVLNVVGFVQVSKQSRKLFDQIKITSVEEAMKVLQNEKRTGKMVGLITAAFLFVYVPLIITMVRSTKDSYENPMIGVLSFGCAHLLVVVDPLVYIFSSKKYRDAIKMILTPSCSRVNVCNR